MTAKCFVCGVSDAKMVYLRCVTDGEDKFVCARCLPVLIHGAH